MLRYLIFLEQILLYLRCNIAKHSHEFQREFLTSEAKKGANTAQAVSRETFELFLRHFFDCVEGTSRQDIIFHKTLSYGLIERGRGSSPLSLISFPSTGERVGESVSQRKLRSAVHRSDNDIVGNGVRDDTENMSLKSSFTVSTDDYRYSAFITRKRVSCITL